MNTKPLIGIVLCVLLVLSMMLPLSVTSSSVAIWVNGADTAVNAFCWASPTSDTRTRQGDCIRSTIAKIERQCYLSYPDNGFNRWVPGSTIFGTEHIFSDDITGLPMEVGHDVGVEAIVSPVDDGPGTSYPVTVVIKNYGQFPERWFNTNVQIGAEIQSNVYATDFETDTGGFNQTGSHTLWAWGRPASGPYAAHSGNKLWATVLGGNYGNYANERLDSPWITVPSTSNAKLAFWHWFSTESYWDGGNVKWSVDGTNWYVLGSYLNPYNEDAMSLENLGCPGEPGFSSNSGGWKYVVMNLSAITSPTFKIRFHFGSDPEVSSYPGWYIDDVRVYTFSVEQEYNDEDWQGQAYLYPGETREIVYDSWTPEAVAEGNSTAITYVISASTFLTGDTNSTNDGKTEEFVLTYIHDVTIKDFTEPRNIRGGRDEVIFSQRVYTPHENWSFYLSADDAGSLCQDDFWNLTDMILGMHWDGLPLIYNGGWMQGNPEGMTFEISFYTDSGGAPGSEVITLTGLQPTYDEGELYAGMYQAYFWSVELPEAVTLEDGWLSIQSINSPEGSWFLWGGSPEGNLNALQNGAGLGDSLAFVLTTIGWHEPTPVYVKKGSTKPIQVLISNGGTFVETCVVNAKLIEFITDPYNGTILYNDSVTGIDLGPLGDEEAVDFQDQLYSLEGIYALYAAVDPASTDDVPMNNHKWLGIGCDGSAPVSSYTLRPTTPDGDHGWYKGNVTVKLSAYDPWYNDVSSGVAKIDYQIDGGAWQTYPGFAGFKLTTDGQHTVKYRATDKVGNVETEQTIPVINIDKTDPTISLSYTVTDSNPLMNRYELTFVATASDATSGLDRCEFSFNGLLQVTLEGPGPDYRWSYNFSALPHVIVKAIVYDTTGNSISAQIEDPADLQIIAPQTQQPYTKLKTYLIDYDNT